MLYLGGLCGAGDLIGDEGMIARADYDFDGFLTKPGLVIGCGEIRMSRDAMKDAFGRKNLQLRTDGGRLLQLRFSEKKLPAVSETAHVDVAGELPAENEWRR